MKVQLCETVSVDVETEVDVSINDILMEFSRRLETCKLNNELPPYKSLMLPLIDFATQMMAEIPVAAIEQCKESQRVEVRRRLAAELNRWHPSMINVERDL